MSWKIKLKPVRAVVGLLIRDNKILVAKRPEGKPYSGYWEFPGGKIEDNESSEAALKRELYEELGIQLIKAQFCFSHTHSYPDKIVLLSLWLIKDYALEPLAKEGQLLKWVDWNELNGLKILEGNFAMIQKIKNNYLNNDKSARSFHLSRCR